MDEGPFRGPPDDFGFRGRPEGFGRRPFADAEIEQFRPPFERDIEPLLPWNRLLLTLCTTSIWSAIRCF